MLENGVFSRVPFCFRSREHFERCDLKDERCDGYLSVMSRRLCYDHRVGDEGGGYLSNGELEEFPSVCRKVLSSEGLQVLNPASLKKLINW